MKILIVTGRTGGHFFPAKAFSQAFLKENPDAEVHFVVSKRTSGQLLEEEIEHSRSIHYLPSFPWSGVFNRKIINFIFSLSKAFRQSWKLVRRLKPDLVVGFGSYLAFPMIISARLNNVPAIIHEQNAVLGKSNRLLIPFVSQVAISFSDTINQNKPGKFIHTGNIIRHELIQSAGQLMRNRTGEGPLRVLVVGGSQGASGMNKLVLDAFSKLGTGSVAKLVVTHLSGEKDFQWVEESYKKLGMPAKVEAFSNEIANLYLETDLLISRSGAGAIFEAVLFQLPSILIPYPHAGSHQAENARVLSESGNAWIIDERNQNSALHLAEKIEGIINSSYELNHIQSRMKNLLKVDDGGNLALLAAGLIKLRTSKKTEKEHVTI